MIVGSVERHLQMLNCGLVVGGHKIQVEQFNLVVGWFYYIFSRSDSGGDTWLGGFHMTRHGGEF